MKVKKILAFVLTLCMVVSLFPAVFAAEEADALSFADAVVTKLAPKVDGKTVNVTWYADDYLALPNSEKQHVNVYIPENATETSPIMFYVNNSGWLMNDYPTNTIEDGKDYDGTNNKVGVALKEGYVVVSYGCRSRIDPVIGHSPATMTDTKAVIRYLRYNDELIPAGDTEKIVITGTSGGGALSVIIAASGDSSDYYPSLYEVGAAGITKNADGTYTSTISDAIWATIAYCPITDLGNACAAYDWTWGAARTKLMADGSLSYKGATAEEVNANAKALTAIYEEYLDSLGLEAVSAANMKETIIGLMKAEIDESIKEIGVEQMKKDLGEATWLKFNEDGSYEYDYDAHVLWVAQQTALKISPAFSNVGTGYGEFMNEDNLFGKPEDVYSPFNEYSWSIDATENKVGQDDTGKTWDEYMATEDGKALALQIKMTNPIPYLLDAKDGKSAPNWYVRYGMADRDSSFAVEAVLNAAMEADKSIEDKTFEFAWLKPHSGDYDVPEAYAWLKQQLLEEAGKNTDMADAVVTQLTPTVDGKPVKVTWYADGYLDKANSEKQYVNVYVPENATEASPIMFYVNNSGWMQNNYPTNTIENGKDYNGTTDRVGVALKEGYVVVSYGCRSRTDAVVGHSPATMTDTKAVIRYLRANEDILVGDTEKIVITGTSGGGALSVIIAASGNSADYYPSLYEVGAAGITKNADGTYTSTIRDDIFATIAYCPITDLGNACAAYDWTWGAARTQLMADGSLSYKGATAEQVDKNAEALTAIYEEYLDSLGLESVSAKNLKDTIIGLMKAEIDESIKEIGVEQMKKDLGDATWLKFNEGGSYEYDYDAHTLWVAKQTALKISPAFSNVGTGYKEFMNEDNLFGNPEDVYSPFNEYSWSIDATENKVGQDDTGLTWDEYMATEDGKRLALQIKMTNPIPYLLDAKDGDSAPYWYVRYGMADRDSSFAVEAVLNAAMEADKSIVDKTFEFAWLKPHSGNYDVPEAYAWLKSILPVEFEDVADDAWYADAVETVVEAGLMNGVSGTKFAPQGTMTRAMLATILYRMAGEPAVEKAAEFKDVEAGKWYTDAIAWAAAEGIVNGYGDGLFGTNEAVTREQFVTMLYRYQKSIGAVEGEGADIADFADADKVGDWAVEAIEWAVGAGIIKGNPDGTINPKGTATRAEAAVMLGRI